VTYAVDTSEMVVVHDAVRREFEEAPALIRSVGAGDRSHAEAVGAHLQSLLELLHQHHDGEDRLLWPKLRARIGAKQQPAIDLMEQHHAAIHVEVTQATAVLGRWRTFAHQRDREPWPTASSGSRACSTSTWRRRSSRCCPWPRAA
jgi:hypothetical protein